MCFTLHSFRFTLRVMQMILMGTGTSHGIPVIGCECKVCTSRDKKDKRFRCSAYITSGDTSNKSTGTRTDIVIDTGPEFRMQALQYHIRRLDAVLLTHSHADHLHGLDDLRIFSFVKPHLCDADKKALDERRNACTGKNGYTGKNGCTGNKDFEGRNDAEGKNGCAEPEHAHHHSDSSCAGQVTNPYFKPDMEPLPIYANSNTIIDVKNRFDYVFHEVNQGGGKPQLDMRDCVQFTPEHPIIINTLQILPVPLFHGSLPDSGWLVSEVEADGKKHSFAYLTDCSSVPDSSIRLILEQAGILDHLVIDGLRVRPHSTHFSFDEALACAEKIGAKHTWLTHICHDKSHRDIVAYVNGQLHLYPVLESIVEQGGTVGPAYDGLTLKPDKVW